MEDNTKKEQNKINLDIDTTTKEQNKIVLGLDIDTTIKEQDKIVLGLDIGTNSIGWSVIKYNFEEKKGNIIATGSRIVPMDKGELNTFSSGATISKTAERTTMKGEDFLQRFVLHILPVRFQKVRHNGFLSSRNKTSVLKNIRKQIGEKIPESQKHLTWQEIFQIKNNKPHNLCKKCQTGIMQITERVPPQRGSPIIIISKKEVINSFENIR